MDSGGSMTPYAALVNRLFSAAHQMSHFKDFQAYYFHNCIYDEVYADIYNSKAMPCAALLQNLAQDYKVIIVGDAYMAASELYSKGGAIDYYYHNETPGVEWLSRFADHFRHTAWLNPMPERTWFHTTISAVGRIFPMFPLTIEGIEMAVKKLMVSR
jgi:uncharacterized protein with von Willebrand factor type A (vWA) domain